VKLGILGGTFNPIHFGHLRVAEEIREDLDLEKVYLVPSGIPPHKTQVPVADFSHRLEMVKLASKTSPFLEPWDIEGKRPGLSYSIETLKMFHASFGSDLELFFIIGTDAFMDLKTWREYRNLFEHASFVVINRPFCDEDKFFSFLKSLDVGFVWEPEKKCFRHMSGNILTQKSTTLIDISSSRIRELINRGKSIRFLVPEVVREYIENIGLYLINESAR
jgi:nicotinate-nucleotide adenylyltransferase